MISAFCFCYKQVSKEHGLILMMTPDPGHKLDTDPYQHTLNTTRALCAPPAQRVTVLNHISYFDISNYFQFQSCEHAVYSMYIFRRLHRWTSSVVQSHVWPHPKKNCREEYPNSNTGFRLASFQERPAPGRVGDGTSTGHHCQSSWSSVRFCVTTSPYLICQFANDSNGFITTQHLLYLLTLTYSNI